MKATEQYFPVVLFIMVFKMGLTFECVDEILKRCMTIHEAAEQYFLVMLFVFHYFETQNLYFFQFTDLRSRE